MLGLRVSRLFPAYRRLLRDGGRAQAVVLRWELRGPYGNNRSHRCALTLRVHFGDGQTTEIRRIELDRAVKGRSTPGAIVPVRYDPADRSRIEIDLPALQAAVDDERAAAEQRLVDAAEARLADEDPTARRTTSE